MGCRLHIPVRMFRRMETGRMSGMRSFRLEVPRACVAEEAIEGWQGGSEGRWDLVTLDREEEEVSTLMLRL